MKKLLILAMLFSFVALFGACGGGGSKNNNPITQNIVNGKQLYFAPESNYSNVGSDEQGLILVSGQTYDFKAYVQNASGEIDSGYNCSNTAWTISGIGYFGSSNVKSTVGETVTMTINAPANTTGTLKLALDGMIFSFPVKIAASIQ